MDSNVHCAVVVWLSNPSGSLCVTSEALPGHAQMQEIREERTPLLIQLFVRETPMSEIGPWSLLVALATVRARD